MDDIHEYIDGFFDHLSNYGSVTDKQLAYVLTLCLLDDYEEEMLECNQNWIGTINSIRNSIIGSSCMFGL